MTDANAHPAPPPTSALRWPEVVALVVCTLVLILFRLHAFDVPLETDEANYAYIASRLLDGDRLYVDVWDHQPPGVYVLFAALQTAFGDAPSVYRWAATAFSAASLCLVFAIVRRCAGSGAAIVSAAIFSLASSDPGTAGEGCNREIFMTTFILSAWWCMLRKDSPDWGHALIAGSLLGFASWIKTIVAIHWLALGVLVVLMRTRERRSRLPKLIAAYCGGPASLWAATALYFGATQRFAEFMEAVFTFNLDYSAGNEPFFARFATFFAPSRHPFVFSSALPLWIAGAAATVWLIHASIARRSRTAGTLLLLIVASYLASALPGHFWPHYYNLLIAPLILATAVGLSAITRRIQSRPIVAWLPAAAVVLLVGVTEYRSYLSQPPFGVTVTRYNSRDFWGRAIGEKVKQVTDPDDAVFVFGNEAEIYYYSRRRCASRYTMITAINPSYAGAAAHRERLLADLQESRPRLIIVLFDQEPFPAWLEFLNKGYGQAVGWDCDDRYTEACDQPAQDQLIMLVFADQERPIERIDWNWDRAAVGGWFLGERR